MSLLRFIKARSAALLALVCTLAAAPAVFAEEGDVEISAENFPDSIFKTYISDNIDANSYDVLSSDEVNAVEQLSVNNMGIASIDGIKCFTNSS